MKKLKIGVAMLLVGILIASFSELIADQINPERPFGELPLSIKLVRSGLITATLGIALMLYGGWENRKSKQP